MKKILILTALLCSASFASKASSDVASKLNAEATGLILLSPTRLESGSFSANGQTYVFVYDSSIPGDFENALTAAVAYAATRK